MSVVFNEELVLALYCVLSTCLAYTILHMIGLTCIFNLIVSEAFTKRVPYLHLCGLYYLVKHCLPY